MSIQKNVIQTWKSKKLPDNFKVWSETWKKMNPDFNYMFFDDRDCLKLVHDYYPEYLSLYESLITIEKTDLFRYLVLHKYGGIYADMDTECLKPMTPLLDLFENSVITGYEYERPVQYLQWFIACPKGFKTMLELAQEVYFRSWLRPFKSLTLSKNELVYYTTGPVMYTSVLRSTKEKVNVLDKGRLGCYDKSKVDRNSYIIHHFAGSWK